MLKEKLLKALTKSIHNIRTENDNLPLSMRGELEVIARDRNGNIISYERGHNQVTDYAKMMIIHLLAGELFSADGDLYSYVSDNGVKLFSTTNGTDVVQQMRLNTETPLRNYHTISSNTDGTTVSSQQYFFDGNFLRPTTSHSQTLFIDQINDGASRIYNYPTKMLFGTGLEAKDDEELRSVYAAEAGATVPDKLINTLNGFAGSDSGLDQNFFTNTNVASNYYSNSIYRARTLQPVTTNPITTAPLSSDSSITGAIKDCLISTTGDTEKYSAVYRMADAKFRGTGHPAFIYAQRTTPNFYNGVDTDIYTHYNYDPNVQSASGNKKYETELIYVVNMPAQPVNVESVSSFYPYNGWILKQAGLFCDSKYLLRSAGEDNTLFDGITTVAQAESGNNPAHLNLAAGTLLFKRNLSSPILKTPDISITFSWHIYITTN